MEDSKNVIKKNFFKTFWNAFWLPKRFLKILFPISILAFLLIALSITFGTTQAGKGVGAFEGVLVLVIGICLVYSKPLGTFLKKYFARMKTKFSAVVAFFKKVFKRDSEKMNSPQERGT